MKLEHPEHLIIIGLLAYIAWMQARQAKAQQPENNFMRQPQISGKINQC